MCSARGYCGALRWALPLPHDYVKVPRRVVLVAIEIRQGRSQISRKTAFPSETRFAPLLAISSALVMSELESNPSIFGNHDSFRDFFKHQHPRPLNVILPVVVVAMSGPLSQFHAASRCHSRQLAGQPSNRQGLISD